jgi:molecular chaperone GrpE
MKPPDNEVDHPRHQPSPEPEQMSQSRAGAESLADEQGADEPSSEPEAASALGQDEPEAAEAPAPDPAPPGAAPPPPPRWKDQCLRTAADFDNFRKRARRDIEDAGRRGREELLRELLPVFDNLERAVSHAESATDVKALADGIQMVMRLFADTLHRLGVERLDALGEPFDPALHEAIQQLETDEYPPGAVAAEVLAGYRIGERLVRPATVVVAKPKTPPASDAQEPQ